MKLTRHLLPLALATLLAACLVAVFLTGGATTREAIQSRPNAKPASPLSPTQLDDRLMQSARQLVSIADTPAEITIAREALRLADHELDQSFASALREAASAPTPSSGPLKILADRIAQCRNRIAAANARIAKLTKLAATDEDAASELEVAKAELALDENELGDLHQDLDRQGGDKRAAIDRARQAHQAAQQDNALPTKLPAPFPTGTLSEQAQVWRILRDRHDRLQAATQQAANRFAVLTREHNTLRNLIQKQRNPTSAAAPSETVQPAAQQDELEETEEEEDAETLVTRLRALSDQAKTLTELNRRIQDSLLLTQTYKSWAALVEVRQQAVLHQLLRSFAAVLAVLLGAVLLLSLTRKAFRRKTGHRRHHQLQVIASIVIQLIAAGLILLIVFGPPSQMSTIIGLTTAGLTVALKDFIVSFFGWFTLIGKNGIRVGDWVEIEGVGGEVIDIGILRTVLLEMGNWANTGHPTGRRVAFSNSFAIERHYFNFSTAGQWLWDELQLSLPPGAEAYPAAERIRDTVERETEADGRQAELDWERVTAQYGVRPFSARPTVDLRPSVNGLDVHVRYITRAPQRFQVKSRLFQAIVNLLHKPAAS